MCTFLHRLAAIDMGAQKNAAVVIDDWKLPIFRRHLQGAGYVFKECGALTVGTLVLSVQTTNTLALSEVLKAANAEAANKGNLQ